MMNVNTEIKYQSSWQHKVYFELFDLWKYPRVYYIICIGIYPKRTERNIVNEYLRIFGSMEHAA